MRNITQNMINSCDKTTVYGLTEAILIAMSNLRNSRGLLMNISFSNNPDAFVKTAENIKFANQIAQMMLGEKT